jgi:osmoprotectant transport system substrate-binding protein
MMLTRARALGLLAAAAALPSCGNRGPVLRVGSKNFTESFVIAEIYAQALEAHGFHVDRRFDLGSVQIATGALQHGDIDLYPEYTGTALIDVLHMAPMSDPRKVYATVKREFERRFGLTWLAPAPMNDSQALATTQVIASRYHLQTLSQASVLAPQLRLATIHEFLSRADALPGLQRVYGGFKFKEVRVYEIGLKYEALLNGQADIATAFTTDGAIGANNLVVLKDDRHLWPPYNVAPVVRQDVLTRYPRTAPILNATSAFITDAVAQQMNYAVEHDKADPADVAARFLREHHI